MSAKRRNPRRRLLHLAVFLLAAAGFGCSPQREEPTAAVPSPRSVEATQTARVLDLTADLPGALCERPTRALAFEPGEFGRLGSGWHRPEEDSEGHRFAWTRGRDSVATFFITEPQDRLLILDLEPLISRQALPHQNVRVLWNGEIVGTLALDRERRSAEIALPAERQIRGPNRLDLLPLYWIQQLAVGAAFDVREVGVKVHSLRLEGGTPEAGDASPPASVAGDEIRQEPGSVLTWAYSLPQAAHLRGLARLEAGPGLLTGMARGRVTLSLRRGSGPERVLFARSLAELSQELEFDTPLGPGEDAESDFASISASFWLPADLAAGLPREAWPRLYWRGLRIEGSEAEAPREVAVKRDRYNVLFILFDTLRADFTSLGDDQGSQITKTPQLDRLAASGVTFRNARASASWTLASVASLLTGLHPVSHGVLDHDTRLAGGTPYLPALLEAAGYRTLGISNNAYNSPAFGFERGYAQLHPYYEERERVRSELTTPEAQAERVWQRFIAPALKDAQEAGAPLFTLLHEIDPHSPYQPPSPFAERHDFGYQGNVDGWSATDFSEGVAMLRAVNDLPRWLQEADLRYLRSRYAGEVEFMDAYLGWLLDRLEAEGLREKTLVVFVSDHGEQFMEHGTWGHGRSVYEEELRVPLVFSLPGVLPAEQRLGFVAEGVDVAPTILDLLGLPRPEQMQGESLLPPMLAAPSSDPPRATYARSNLQMVQSVGDGKIWDTVRLGRWKLLRLRSTRESQPFFQFELYDLDADPEEMIDRWPTEPVVGEALRQLLVRRGHIDEATRQRATAPVELTPKARENLRALGYVE